jgi:hypothetical protein
MHFREAKSDNEKAGERDPLLSPAVPMVEGTPEQRLLQTSKYVNANSPWYLFVGNVALVVTTIIAVVPATCFVRRNYHLFMPHCNELGSLAHEITCSAFTFGFWSYPIICPVIACFIVQRRFIETRLYYESFLNGIHVDIVEDPMMNPMVWVLLLWGLAAAGVIVYITEPFTATAKAQYFLPMFSFLIFVFAKWNINAYLITLPDYCSTDPEYARSSLDNSTQVYVSEPQIRVAFENLNDELDDHSRVSSSTLSVPPMTTSRFFGKLREHAHKEMRKYPAKKLDPPGFMERTVGMCGLVARTPWIDRYQKISRPEVMSTCFSLRKGFWASRILFNKHLDDVRSRSFRRWYTAFSVFVFLEIIVVVVYFCQALAQFLVYERYEESSSTLIWVLKSFGFADVLDQVANSEAGHKR